VCVCVCVERERERERERVEFKVIKKWRRKTYKTVQNYLAKNVVLLKKILYLSCIYPYILFLFLSYNYLFIKYKK